MNYSKKEIIERLENGYMFVGNISVKVRSLPFPCNIWITQFSDRIEISDQFDGRVVLPSGSSYDEIRKEAVKLLNS